MQQRQKLINFITNEITRQQESQSKSARASVSDMPDTTTNVNKQSDISYNLEEVSVPIFLKGNSSGKPQV